MKKLLFLFSVAVLFIACGGGDNGTNPSNPPGAPEWSAGYPEVAYGAVSVDLNLQTDKATKVYWVIANKSLSLDAEEIRSQAKSPSNASIKFHGTTVLKTNEAKTETVTKLLEHTNYFTYLVAENTADTVLQVEVSSSNFTTYYKQDTSTYHSTVESRDVLFLIYRPEEVLKYPSEKYPILFFLGGNGEVAAQDKLNYFNGNRTLPEYIHKGNDVPLMVFTIQHIVQNWNVKLIDEGVSYGLATYPVDPKKVYMSGCSGGGFACWNYSVDHADKLAAIVPISGGGPSGKACNLKNISIWAFHNAIDGTVASSNSTNMINAVKACPPNKEVKLTFFEDIDLKAHHDCWRRVFNQDDADWKNKTPDMPKFDIYAWLLSKSK